MLLFKRLIPLRLSIPTTLRFSKVMGTYCKVIHQCLFNLPRPPSIFVRGLEKNLARIYSLRTVQSIQKTIIYSSEKEEPLARDHIRMMMHHLNLLKRLRTTILIYNKIYSLIVPKMLSNSNRLEDS